MATRLLKLPALQIQQGPERVLYSFAVDGKELEHFTTVSRIKRDDEAQIHGYQRPEVLSHIKEIKRYLESDAPMIPNALVVAFDTRVTFEPANGMKEESGYSRHGTLTIPINEETADNDKPGWLVDGQQRAAAIRDARISRFPICVTAFITDSAQEQRSQFILVNSTKPLPKGLIYELLPTTTGALPSLLTRRRFPATLLNRLNHDQDSPLRHMIRTPTVGGGVIKDNSILKMLENSLSDGALYLYRDARTGEGDIEAMLSLLKEFWAAVSDVFERGWDKPARHSRLMHGVGIVSLGYLMDAITDRKRGSGPPSRDEFAADLMPLQPICRWTNGYWEFGPGNQRKWNELQNTSKDIQLLANFLLIQYKLRVWSRASASIVGAEHQLPGLR